MGPLLDGKLRTDDNNNEEKHHGMDTSLAQLRAKGNGILVPSRSCIKRKSDIGRKRDVMVSFAARDKVYEPESDDESEPKTKRLRLHTDAQYSSARGDNDQAFSRDRTQRHSTVIASQQNHYNNLHSFQPPIPLEFQMRNLFIHPSSPRGQIRRSPTVHQRNLRNPFMLQSPPVTGSQMFQHFSSTTQVQRSSSMYMRRQNFCMQAPPAQTAFTFSSPTVFNFQPSQTLPVFGRRQTPANPQMPFFRSNYQAQKSSGRSSFGFNQYQRNF